MSMRMGYIIALAKPNVGYLHRDNLLVTSCPGRHR